jgi:hypothetical protein
MLAEPGGGALSPLTHAQCVPTSHPTVVAGDSFAPPAPPPCFNFYCFHDLCRMILVTPCCTPPCHGAPWAWFGGCLLEAPTPTFATAGAEHRCGE